MSHYYQHRDSSIWFTNTTIDVKVFLNKIENTENIKNGRYAVKLAVLPAHFFFSTFQYFVFCRKNIHSINPLC